MAILEDEQRTLVIGVVAGLAAAGVAKFVGPAFSGAGRPLLKALIKAGLMTYERGREGLAQAAEVVEDLFAEARSELDAEARQAIPPTVTTTSPASNGGL